MSLKIITVDFWNTIFDSSSGIERNKYRLKTLVEETDKLGCFIKQDELDTAMKSSWEYFNQVWMSEQRTPSSIELVKFFWEKLLLPESKDSIQFIADAFANSVLIHPPKLVNGVRQALENLKDNYRLAIVSDTGFSGGNVLRKLLEKESIIQYFDAFSFSDETRVAKPRKEAFQKVLDELDAQPHEGLHIGDIENTDILGAKSIGMKAIRFIGDSSRFLVKENPENSIADFETDDWAKIPELIKKLN
jgi:putative hydrolase of the HAD superfamily